MDAAVAENGIRIENNRYFIRVMHRGIRAGLILHGLFLCLFLWLGVAPLVYFNIASVVTYGVCIRLLKRKRYRLAILLSWLEIVGHAVVATALLGIESGFQYYLIVLVPLTFINANRSNLQRIILTTLLCLVYIALDTPLGQAFRIDGVDTAILAIMRYSNISALFWLWGHLAYLYAKTVALGEARLTQANVELRKALSEVRTLRGILPLCSFCKKIRDDQGYWNQVEVYLQQNSEADISHGVCPECAAIHYPEYKKK